MIKLSFQLLHVDDKELVTEAERLGEKTHSCVFLLLSYNTEHFCDHIVRGFSHKQFSTLWGHRCLIIQFSLIESDPTGEGLINKSYKTTALPFQMPSQIQVVTCASDHLAINQSFPQSPPLTGLICGSQNSEKATYQRIILYKRI